MSAPSISANVGRYQLITQRYRLIYLIYQSLTQYSSLHRPLHPVCFNTMYEASNNLLTANLLSHFKKVNESHDHNTRKNKNNFNIRFARTTKKAASISVKGPKIWDTLKAEVKLCSIQEKI